MRLKVDKFNGMIPVMKAHGVPLPYADICLDVDTSGGTIKPIRKPLKVGDMEKGALHIHSWDKHFMPMPVCASTVEWLSSCPTMIAACGNGKPFFCELNTDTGIGKTYPLGIPYPNYAPFATVQGAVDKNPDTETVKTVFYQVSFANDKYQESAMSFPSNQVEMNDGQECIISGISVPADRPDICYINIYRCEAFYAVGDTNSTVAQNDKTAMFLIATLPASAVDYRDTIKAEDVIMCPVNANCYPPPADLDMIEQVYDGKSIVGQSRGNMLVFSRRGEYWAYPQTLQYNLDDNIRGIKTQHGGIVHVATDGCPYTVIIGDECDDFRQLNAIRHKQSLPMIGHKYYSIIGTPYGTIYNSISGLVLLEGKSPPVIITSQLFSEEQWRALTPETMRLGYYRGRLFFCTDTVSFSLMLHKGDMETTDAAMLCAHSFKPDFMLNNRAGEMFYVQDNALYQWAAGDGSYRFHWQSGVMRVKDDCFNALRYFGCGGNHITLKNNNSVVFDEFVSDKTLIRLPFYGMGKEFSFSISGENEVISLELAECLQSITS